MVVNRLVVVVSRLVNCDQPVGCWWSTGKVVVVSRLICGGQPVGGGGGQSVGWYWSVG